MPALTDYTFASQAQLTEFLENSPLYIMTNSQLWNDFAPQPLSPFYYEAESNTVNFGYGINLVAAAHDTQLQTEINKVLASLSEPVTITAAQWNILARGGTKGTSTAATLQSVTAALNSVAEDNVPSIIQLAAATSSQYKLYGIGYSNSAVVGVENEISNFGQLSQSARNALVDLQYNTGGSFWGTSIIDALDQDTPDYAAAAYQLAFNTSTESNTTYESRSLIDAAQMLGLRVTIDGNHLITDLTASSDASNSIIVKFLQTVANNNPTTYLALPDVVEFMSSLVSYTATQGYYVPQPGDIDASNSVTWNNIASQVNEANDDISITGAQLSVINTSLPGESLSAGGLVYVPISVTSLTATSSFTPPTQTGSGQTFVVAPTTSGSNSSESIYTVGASFNTNGVSSDAGELFVIGSDGKGSHFSRDSWQSVSAGPNNTIYVDVYLDQEVSAGLTGDDAGGDVIMNNGDTLVLNNPTQFVGTISNFVLGDTIDLAGVTATSATLGANNVLNIQESNGSTLSLQLDNASTSPNYASYIFAIAPDGNGGTDIINPILSDNFNEYTDQDNWTPPATPPVNWIVVNGPAGSVDLADDYIIANGEAALYAPYGNFVDLDGTTSSPGSYIPGILQSKRYFSGGTYTLSFDLSGNARLFSPETTIATLGNFSTPAITLASDDFFSTHTYTFTTTGGYLRFFDPTGGNQRGNLLDNVRLNQATVTPVTASQSGGTANTGGTIQLSLDTSQPVTVANGTPTLALSDGAVATYDPAASTPSDLVFDYAVGATDYATNLAVTGLNLNGADITGAAGTTVNVAPQGVAQSLGFDVNAAIVTAVTPSQAGEVFSGQTVALTVTMSEAVTVDTTNGLPALILNDGATATYDASASNPSAGTLVFDYAIGATDSTANLTIVVFDLNGALINDNNGNAADLSGASNQKTNLQVGPTFVSAVMPSQTSEIYSGQTISITLTMSTGVTLDTTNGSPTLSLSDGGIATYDVNASDPSNGTLVFDYTVGNSDYAADLQVNGVTPNGATFTDTHGDAVDFSGADEDLGLAVNVAVFTAVTPSTQSGVLAVGQPIMLTVTASAPVSVAGTPTLALNDGGVATYDATLSTPTALVFDYTVAPTDGDVVSLAASAINLPDGASITDSDDNTPPLSLAAIAQTGPEVDSGNPTVAVSINNTATITTVNPTATVTFAFGVAPVDFSLSDTTAVGGTLSNLQGSGATYTATFTGAANTHTSDASVAVISGSYHDSDGNAGSSGSTGPFSVDTEIPTVAVELDIVGDALNLQQPGAEVFFEFSKPVHFSLSDATAVGGTLGGLRAASIPFDFGGTLFYEGYSAGFTAAANTDITNASISVTGGSYQDSDGNPGSGGSSSPFDVDTVQPTVSVAIDNPDISVANPTGTVTFAFSVAPQDFNLSDVTAAGGTVSNLQGSGTTYTATFTGSPDIDITNASVTVADDSYSDADGNSGVGGSTMPFTVDTVLCYCRGTRIRTDRSEVAVEALKIGDRIMTLHGEARPIKWIGHRNIDIARHPRPELARPVRIEAGALGEGRPVRDLLLSPEHALWFENALVPARDLINGATIRQEPWNRVEYFHVELDSHDILLAEGVPAESYLDCDNRSGFDNAPDGVVTLHPDWRRRAASRPFASAALTARLRTAFVDRAVALGCGADVEKFQAEQLARGRVTRTNFVRNPRAEGSVSGRLGEEGNAPFYWWLNAPDGVAIDILGAGDENGLPFVDLRVAGRAVMPGHCCVYPEPGKSVRARPDQDWTVSCYLRHVGGTLDGVDRFNLYVDEYGADGAYLTGQDYPQPHPTDDGLALQRITATRRMSRPDVAAMTGYIQIQVAADAAIDVTLRVAGLQIEEGPYASELMLPPPGEPQATIRHAADASSSQGAMSRAA